MICSVACAWCTIIFFSSVMSEWLYHVDNEPFMVSEGATGKEAGHSIGEGKCPLTYLCPTSHENLQSRTT
jgi:hypothetical protein